MSLSPAVKLCSCPEAVDMGLGFDGLFGLVRNHLKADPLSGHLFIFRNRVGKLQGEGRGDDRPVHPFHLLRFPRRGLSIMGVGSDAVQGLSDTFSGARPGR
jgi:hypothetical protein